MTVFGQLQGARSCHLKMNGLVMCHLFITSIWDLQMSGEEQAPQVHRC